MTATWTWFLTDSSNKAVMILDDVTARQITYTRNLYAEATCTMLQADPAAVKLFSMLFGTGEVPRLQGWRSPGPGQPAVCRFCGVWAPSQEDLSESATIALTFRSPFSIFYGDGSTRGRFTDASVPVTLGNASEVAGHLLRRYGSADVGAYGATITDTPIAAYAGLDIGTLEIGGTSVSPFPAYVYYNVGQGLVDLTKIDGGIDFYERFAPDQATGRMAFLDTYAGPGIGSDKSAGLRFEYGAGTLDNVSEVQRGLDYPVNNVTVLGANNLVAIANDGASIDAYGQWSMNVSATTISDQTQLNNIAAAYLRPTFVKTISVSPELSIENCPKPFDDYDLGDVVAFAGTRDSFHEAVTLQINIFTVGIEDDSGQETMVLTDPLDPAGEETVRAQIIGEVLANQFVIDWDAINQAWASDFPDPDS